MARKRNRETAGCILRRVKKGLSPISQFDEEQLDKFPLGTEFLAKPLTKRSLPHHRTYWKALTSIVEATDRWPTAEHLHGALMRDLGYIQVTYGLDGKPFLERDSIAFDNMRQTDFKDYFDKAMKRLAEATGIDPLGWLDPTTT